MLPTDTTSKALLIPCRHCGASLSVGYIPACGECPKCGGFIEISISTTRHSSGCPDEPPSDPPSCRISKFGWAIAAILLVLLVAVIFLTETRVWIFATRIDGYQPAKDNRFTSWPWSAAPNPDCRIPTTALAAVGWDVDGHFHALIGPSSILITHDNPPSEVNFESPNGNRFTRRVTETFTLSQELDGRPWIRICKLDHPLPPSIQPLPVINPPDASTINREMYVIGRQGRIGREFEAVVKTECHIAMASGKTTTKGMLVTKPDRPRCGQVRLRAGDSGSPVIVRIGETWALAASACAVRTSGPGQGLIFEHLYAMPGPHIAAMKALDSGIRELPFAPTPLKDQPRIESTPTAEQAGFAAAR